MQGISILGVLVGGVFDIVISSVGGAILIAVILGSTYAAGGSHPDAKQLADIVSNSTSVETGLVAYGALVSVAAGYLAAWIAKRREVLNGALSSFLCVGQGVFMLASSPARHGVGYTMLEIVLPPLCGLAGGYLRTFHRSPVTAA